MKPQSRGRRSWVLFPWLGLFVLPFLTSCTTGVLATKQRVFVDAISASPEVVKEAGVSYRLIAKRSVVSGQPVSVQAIIACVNAALAGKGMYESAPNTPPDLFIEVSYGRNSLPREVPHANEVFLQLVGRKNRARTLEPTDEEEMWDVRVAVPGVTARMESVMPLLAAVASEHVGADTQIEMPVDVLKSSPVVKAVRETATTALRLQTAEATPPPVPPATTPTTSVPAGETAPAAPPST